jgi:yersiniabactin nonribosomal peptide synthetase
LLISGLLDGGYAHFDCERQQAGTPMLPGAQWAELFARAGWQGVTHHPVGSSFLTGLRARRPATSIDLDATAVRAHAATRLPSHMVPERIQILPWLPLNANGKVDRAAIARLIDPGSDPREEAEAPQGEVEHAIAAMWSQLLGIGGVGRNQSFFALGGDSLLATRFIQAMQERYDVTLPLRRLFAGPTVGEVAAVLARELSVRDDFVEGLL